MPLDAAPLRHEAAAALVARRRHYHHAAAHQPVRLLAHRSVARRVPVHLVAHREGQVHPVDHLTVRVRVRMADELHRRQDLELVAAARRVEGAQVVDLDVRAHPLDVLLAGRGFVVRAPVRGEDAGHVGTVVVRGRPVALVVQDLEERRDYVPVDRSAAGDPVLGLRLLGTSSAASDNSPPAGCASLCLERQPGEHVPDRRKVPGVLDAGVCGLHGIEAADLNQVIAAAAREGGGERRCPSRSRPRHPGWMRRVAASALHAMRDFHTDASTGRFRLTVKSGVGPSFPISASPISFSAESTTWRAVGRRRLVCPAPLCSHAIRPAGRSARSGCPGCRRGGWGGAPAAEPRLEVLRDLVAPAPEQAHDRPGRPGQSRRQSSVSGRTWRISSSNVRLQAT